MSNKRLYERYGIVSEVRMVRALLDGAREAGAVKFEAWTDDEGPDYVGDDVEEILDTVFNVDLGAIVCVDADGTRWGHYQLTPNNDGLIADWRARDGDRADVLADRICGME